MSQQDGRDLDLKSADRETSDEVVSRLKSEAGSATMRGWVQNAESEAAKAAQLDKKKAMQPPPNEDTPIVKRRALRIFEPEKTPDLRVTGTLKESDLDTVILNAEARRALPQAGNLYGFDPGKPTEYRRLPASANGKSNLPSWRIELRSLTSTAAAIGIELLGDVVLGIDRNDNIRPDLDLSGYNGYNHGVSRRHAMLRPTQNRIYLLDLQSLNGTMHNALPLIPGHAPELRNGDIITLGSLSFILRIVAGPSNTKK